MKDLSKHSAYGGKGWSPRTRTTREEIGDLWADCGINTQYKPLKSVLLHRPGKEMGELVDPDSVQMLAIPDTEQASRQHDTLAEAYKAEGVEVHYVDPPGTPTPNQMFVADLMFMTPEGAILARPASTVRAGEERWVARRLAELGIPILESIRGTGVFEGADAAWIDEDTVMVATGHRTNHEALWQLTDLFEEMDVDVIHVGLPYGSMHLMGTLRIVDKDLALCWPGRVPYDAVAELRDRGFSVYFIPDLDEAVKGMPLNFVTLAPRRILMPGGNPVTEAFYDDIGIEYRTVAINELIKAAGAVGCLSGILGREIN
ncbi:MAG: arginine deiminase-related protein [Candidatus Bathyarchaeota archaeon]|nr:arginine deiminase-related protein [Candidatus Bathyarchaeota archaeon]